jgi:ArsR family transcriptional regulator
MENDELSKRAKVFAALSDPARLRILELVDKREICICKLVPKLALSQPTVSYHVGLLSTAGLLVTRKEGTNVHCRTKKGVVKCIRQLSGAAQ